MPTPEPEGLSRLVADGLVVLREGRARTTARWQATVARAAMSLQRAGAPWLDLKLPIAAALLEHYPAMPDAELAKLVEAMLPVEEAELAPVFGERPGSSAR